LDEFFPSKVPSSITLIDEGISFVESAQARLINKKPEFADEVMKGVLTYEIYMISLTAL